MKRIFVSAMCTGLMLVGSQVFAEDMKKTPAMDHEQMMKDCMDKAAMKKDGMSKEQMTKSCQEKMKMHKDGMTTHKDGTMMPNDAIKTSPNAIK